MSTRWLRIRSAARSPAFGGDRVDQRVVGVALAGRVAPPPVERDDQRGTRDQLADEAGEDRLVGEIGDHVRGTPPTGAMARPLSPDATRAFSRSQMAP